MAAYEYQALADGRTTRGVVQADTPRQARQQLRDRGLVPLEVELVGRSTRQGFGAGLGRERSLVLRQLSALLNAGLPLEEALSLIVEQAGRPRVHRPLAAIRSRVMEGQALSEAMREHPGLFPTLYTASVAAGERAGRLDIVIDRLADHAEQRQAVSRGLGVALVYPALLAAIALAVVWGLIGFVVPRVVGVFDRAAAELPLITRSLMAIAEAIEAAGLWLLLGTLLAVIGSIFLFRMPGPRLWLDGLVLRLPFAGRLVRAHCAALFARTLAILVSSGVPVVEALQVASRVINNRVVQADLQAAAARVREGASISRALAPVDWLPPLTRRLIAGGEKAGDLAPMLEHAAGIQEADLKDATSVLLAVLQPVLILIVGALVLYIVLAILLPIMNLSQLLQ